MAEELVCPTCGEADNLSTVESVQGLCRGDFTVDGNGDRVFAGAGYTDVLWETAMTVGVTCRECGFVLMHDEAPTGNAVDALVTADQFAAPKPPKFASQEEADAWLEARSS